MDDPLVILGFVVGFALTAGWLVNALARANYDARVFLRNGIRYVLAPSDKEF